MSRAARLLQLMQNLRRRRFPVSGQELAAELGVSLRTLYRDIAALQAQGADIEGEAGLGYSLKPGFTLPPMMLSAQEIEALVLGARWVSQRADPELAGAARDMLAKVSAVLPQRLRQELAATNLLIGPGPALPATQTDLGLLRQAIRRQHKLLIDYQDKDGAPSQRVVWPFAMGFFDHCRMLLAWCEARGAHRHFRVDRIQQLTALDERYPVSRQRLLRQWQQAEGIDPTGGC
ncbi:MAG: YafY family protein [Pseudomonadota bacterium]|uniref:helix-turn-helix transcriptional regulator n=1 Tax=Gallaecimonas pentaromativorans TaxID=584787 RepID=UPI00067F6037|nr:YafY family protein [Gallaecimonas pentaromativorans]MED5526575.1 YafY family protein [Pseudomonadota bacterium]